jgi:hypothetical protein
MDARMWRLPPQEGARPPAETLFELDQKEVGYLDIRSNKASILAHNLQKRLTSFHLKGCFSCVA